jgi:hypothetical protein
MDAENSNNYLYIGKQSSGAIGYIGIGGVTRPYDEHNPAADVVLQSGDVWITEQPFSTRRDAEMAESLLIQALTWATRVPPDLTNIAKVSYSKHLVPALRYREGTLRYSDLSNALLVKVRPGSLKGRSAPTANTDDFDLTVRCNRWWGLGAAVRRQADVRHLVAVTAHVKPARVIGVWNTHPVAQWWYENLSAPVAGTNTAEPWNGPHEPVGEDRPKGWVATVQSTNPDVNMWQGLEFDWEGYAPQRIGWSRDLRSTPNR